MPSRDERRPAAGRYHRGRPWCGAGEYARFGPRSHPSVCSSATSVLAREVLFALAGVDGAVVSRAAGVDAFRVREGCGASPAVSDHVSRVAECGWLYQEADAWRAALAAGDPPGMVAQALCNAVHAELSEYLRLIASLQAAKSGALTLRQIEIWTLDAKRRLKFVAAMRDAVGGARGGALVSAVFGAALHGDPAVAATLGRIAERAFAPILAMIEEWVFDGEIHDAYSEFFIRVDSATLAEDEVL